MGQGEDLHELMMAGRQMSPADKDKLEEQVLQKPDDVDARTKLLGYYFLRSLRDSESKLAKRQHILWLIEHAPETEVLGSPLGQINNSLDAEGYRQVHAAWQQVIEENPEELSVLKNASRFYLLPDRKLAEEYLLKGKKLDPQDPYWPESLGQLYSLGLVRVLEEAEQKEQAEKAFQEYLQAYELAEDLQRDSLLDRLAKTALAAGQIKEARKYAQQMLADDSAGWNLGNRIHHGNLILGRIALVEGHLDEAKSRLLLAGQTPGSPQLGSFGPNMQLAKEMLEQGEKEVVLEYLNLCKKFWTSPRNRLEEWEEEIKNDRTPNFGGNLSY